MATVLIPRPDTIPVSWGWFQFLLLLVFPLHLLAMNTMLGGLVLGVVQHLRGGEMRRRLAHRIALAAPLVIALTVNLGVGAYLFIQILYGQFIYTSSILLGISWILVVPLLMLAYGGTYLYDFRFNKLGWAGIGLGIVCCLIFIAIAAIFSGNMLLLGLPARFEEYFRHMNGSLPVTAQPGFLPRYLHMVLGALAVGGLYVAVLGRFRADRDPALAAHAQAYGLRAFLVATAVNIFAGGAYLLSLPRQQMLLFMGGDMGATAAFVVSLLLTAAVLVTAAKQKLWLTVAHGAALVYVMVFMRAWQRADALRDYFTLDRLQLLPQYSPMIAFFVILIFGLICLGWLWKKTSAALTGS